MGLPMVPPPPLSAPVRLRREGAAATQSQPSWTVFPQSTRMLASALGSTYTCVGLGSPAGHSTALASTLREGRTSGLPLCLPLLPRSPASPGCGLYLWVPGGKPYHPTE